MSRPPVMTKSEDARRAAAWLTEAVDDADAALDRLNASIAECRRAGVPIRTLAHILGVTRSAVSRRLTAAYQIPFDWRA